MRKINIDTNEIRKLYITGLTGDQIANKLNVSRGIIFDRLENMGITRPQFRFQKGIKHSKDHIKKIALANTGRKVSEETKKKISIANKGKKRTKEYCITLSKYMKGRYTGAKCHLWRGGLSLRYDPIIEKAHNVIRYMKRKGHLMNQPCEICSKPGEVHHDDYMKPKEIKWLCAKHHRRFHMQNELVGYKYVPIKEAG